MTFKIYRPRAQGHRLPSRLNMANYVFVTEAEGSCPVNAVGVLVRARKLPQTDVVTGLLCIDASGKAYVLTKFAKWAEVEVFQE